MKFLKHITQPIFVLGAAGFLVIDVCLFSPETLAESYRSWLSDAPETSQISFSSWDDPEIKTETFPGSIISLPVTPIHGLLGYLQIDQIPEDQFPITITFRYPQLTRSDFRNLPMDQWKSKVGFRWGDRSGKVSELSWIRSPITTRILDVDVSKRSEPIPVWGLLFHQEDRYGRATRSSAYSLLVTVESSTGDEVARRWIVESALTSESAYYRGPRWNGFTAYASDGETFLRKLGIERPIHIRKFPSEWLAYDKVGAIWVNHLALEDSKLDVDVYRRILLSGVFIASSSEDAPALAERLGLNHHPGVLNVGLLDGGEEIPALANINAYPQVFGTSKSAKTKIWETESAAKNLITNLRRYSEWAIAFLVIAGGVVMCWSFLSFKGKSRVKLWVVIPVSSALYGVGIWCAGHLLLNLNPISEVFAFRYSYRDWPEAYEQYSLSLLGFDLESFTLQLVEDCELVAPLDPNWRHWRKETTPKKLLLTSSDTQATLPAPRGRFVGASLAHWVENKPPCEVLANGPLKFHQSFKMVWVWDGVVWRDFGAVKLGDVQKMENGRILFNESDFPSSAWSADANQAGRYYHFNATQQLPRRIQVLTDLRWMKHSHMQGSGVLIGFEEGMTDIEPLWEPIGTFQGNRIWVHQFALNALSDEDGVQ